MEFQKKNLEMSQTILKILIARGDIVSEADALQKLKDRDWITRHGYGHVAHVLASSVGVDACRLIFEKKLSDNQLGD